MSPIVGTRPNAAVNLNRWAGRTLSQQIRRKNWIPPDLAEQRQDIHRISHYSRKDYIIGETSQDVLRSTADRLTNGPSPVGALPEVDLFELESKMAILSAQKSATAEVWGGYEAVELDATTTARVPPDGRTNWPLGGTSGSSLSGDTPTSYRSGPFNEPQELQADKDNTLHNATPQAQAKIIDQKWEQAYSIVTRKATPSQQQDRS